MPNRYYNENINSSLKISTKWNLETKPGYCLYVYSYPSFSSFEVPSQSTLIFSIFFTLARMSAQSRMSMKDVGKTVPFDHNSSIHSLSKKFSSLTFKPFWVLKSGWRSTFVAWLTKICYLDVSKQWFTARQHNSTLDLAVKAPSSPTIFFNIVF